jgi:hypothetical protein
MQTSFLSETFSVLGDKNPIAHKKLSKTLQREPQTIEHKLTKGKIWDQHAFNMTYKSVLKTWLKHGEKSKDNTLRRVKNQPQKSKLA